MYRTVIGIVVVFAVAMGLVALTFSASKEERAEFVFVNGTEPKSLDPAIITGQPEGRIADAIFEGLTYRDPKSLRPVPGSAASWDISDDGLVYTFHMRPDAVWSDGKSVTANDFAWSWRRLEEPATASEYAYILHMIRGAEIFNTYGGNAERLIGPSKDTPTIVAQLDALIRDNPKGVDAAQWRDFVRKEGLNEALKGVEVPLLERALAWSEDRVDAATLADMRAAVQAEGERRAARWKEADRTFGISSGVWAKDDRTLVVELRSITPYFLEITAFYPTYPEPRWVVEAHPTDWFLPSHVVTNGPYRLRAWRVNDKIRLVKSDTYWDRDDIHLRVVDALPIENGATALNMYLTGAADWIPAIYPQDLVDALKERPDFYANQGLVVYYYRFNTTRKYLRDPRVRRALCMAIDRDVIVRHILKLGQEPAYHFVPPGIRGYEPPESRIRFDPKEATRLLKEAGFPMDVPLGILYNTSESHQKIAENVAEQLRQNLGLRANAYNQEWQAYQQTVRDEDYDLARAGWIGDYLDPNTFLDMWVTNGGNNQTGWSSPLYDRLIAFAADVGTFLDDPDPWVARLKEKDRIRRMIARYRSLPPGSERVAVAEEIRMQLFREAEAILVQDGFPVLPIYFYVVSGLVKPWVGGFYTTLTLPDGSAMPNLQDIHPVRGMYIRGDDAGRAD
jgi:oligopeptide transport system substrate-binding protein